MIEEVALALIIFASHLKSYIQSHQIIVKMEHPVKQELRNPELERRIVAWSVELSEFDLQYEPRSPMKT